MELIVETGKPVLFKTILGGKSMLFLKIFYTALGILCTEFFLGLAVLHVMTARQINPLMTFGLLLAASSCMLMTSAIEYRKKVLIQ